jgi:hypothetical protein
MKDTQAKVLPCIHLQAKVLPDDKKTQAKLCHLTNKRYFHHFFTSVRSTKNIVTPLVLGP